MGRKYPKKDKKDKKTTGRKREQKRKVMNLAKLFANPESSSSSSSSSSDDVDPRQNSQIRRNLRRKALRMAAEALNEQMGLGLNSSSSTDTWANKAATLAKALGTVLASQPPAVTKASSPAIAPPPPPPPPPPASAHATTGIHTEVTVPAAGFPFPPIPPAMGPHIHWAPQFLPAGPPSTGHEIYRGPQPQGLQAKQPSSVPPPAVPEEPEPDVPAVPAVPKHSNSAMQMAQLFDEWQLNTRKCSACNQWTYYRNGICINKQCPLNR